MTGVQTCALPISGLSKEEVEKMARDAESNSADDRRKKEEIEARNRADAMIYNIEKMLKEHRDKISEADAKSVEESIEETKKAVAAGNSEQINAATDKLTAASHKLAEAMYKTAGAPTGAPQGDAPPNTQGPEGGKPKDNVVDAEFVDVDEKK